MKRCPACSAMVPEGVLRCPTCGVDPASLLMAPGQRFEFRSRAELFGWPLVHVAQGFDPGTGRVRVARGVIAVGSVAVGGVALGGVAFGVVAFGGVSAGLLAIGGMAVGVAAFGGMAVAAYLAVGGLAISGTYAVGAAALAPHAISGSGADPELADRISHWLERLGLVGPSKAPSPERP